ncbi:MAG TPA: hypothetical protein VHD35_08130 [Chitinophagaceae bacterium]|nr:hypothetical protein [Chitinophagaceae bacterium]
MEVHHHPHAEEKRLKHYLFEFFMLFLAVFCGFLAENFREHQVEKQRGTQYLHSLFEDLKNDTAQCSVSIEELNEDKTALGNLRDCFTVLSRNIRSTDCLKEIIKHSLGFKDFIYSDRTIQQLKNAGGLRLIQNKEIADSIASYDATVREMLIHQSVLENLQQISRNAHNNMIDFIHLSELFKNHPSDSLYLLSNDKERLNQYFNTINGFRIGLSAQLGWMKLIKNQATALLDLINKKGFK